MEQQPVTPAHPTALVIGGGPAGALAAIQLARHGFKVKVAERQQEEEIGKLGPRTYNITLMTRALLALEKAGVVIPDTILCTRPQSQFVSANGKVGSRPASGKGITRPQLCLALLTHCKEHYPEAVEVLYGHTLKHVDLAAKHAVLQSETDAGTELEVQYDLLIGADGARSLVRAAMCDQVPGFSFISETQRCEYKAMTLPQPLLRQLLGVDDTSRVGLVALMASKRKRSVVGSIDSQGLWRGVYMAPTGGFDNLKTEADFDADVQLYFPQLNEELRKEFVSQLTSRPVSGGSVMIRCTQLFGPGVILLGDAGHGVWPTTGQGCNAALEDVTVLAEILHKCKSDVSKIPEAYNAARYPDAVALANLVAYTGFNLAENKKWVTTRWIMCMTFGMMLHRALPSLIAPPATTLVVKDVPYRAIWKQQNREFLAMGTIAAAAAVSAVYAGAKVLGAV